MKGLHSLTKAVIHRALQAEGVTSIMEWESMSEEMTEKKG